jgi:hypothetical protein
MISRVAARRDGALMSRLPILRDAQPPMSGKPDIGARAPQDEADRSETLG